jgi:hypothetical protein
MYVLLHQHKNEDEFSGTTALNEVLYEAVGGRYQ